MFNRVFKLVLNLKKKMISGLEPIHNASSFGHCDVIELLIERGANVNAVDRWEWTPLHESCTRQKLDVAALLIRRGADVNRKNSDDKSPLDLCPDGSDLRLLLTGEYRKAELLEAAKRGDEKTLLHLLTPLNVNAQASDGRKVRFLFFFLRLRLVLKLDKKKLLSNLLT